MRPKYVEVLIRVTGMWIPDEKCPRRFRCLLACSIIATGMFPNRVKLPKQQMLAKPHSVLLYVVYGASKSWLSGGDSALSGSLFLLSNGRTALSMVSAFCLARNRAAL